MPVFRATRRISVQADVAYAVAADVSSYREFLPLLTRSTVLGAPRPTAGGQTFDAELAVSYPKLGLADAFVSKVTTDAVSRTVTAVSSDGPFRALKAVWKITDQGQSTDIAVEIDYTFRNPLLQVVAKGVMDYVVQKVMAAFEDRARAHKIGSVAS